MVKHPFFSMAAATVAETAAAAAAMFEAGPFAFQRLFICLPALDYLINLHFLRQFTVRNPHSLFYFLNTLASDGELCREVAYA